MNSRNTMNTERQQEIAKTFLAWLKTIPEHQNIYTTPAQLQRRVWRDFSPGVSLGEMFSLFESGKYHHNVLAYELMDHWDWTAQMRLRRLADPLPPKAFVRIDEHDGGGAGTWFSTTIFYDGGWVPMRNFHWWSDRKNVLNDARNFAGNVAQGLGLPLLEKLLK